jgi:hypothetical protein
MDSAIDDHGAFLRRAHAQTFTFVAGASIARIEEGKVATWADYYDGLTSRRTALGAFFTEWVEY